MIDVGKGAILPTMRSAKLLLLTTVVTASQAAPLAITADEWARPRTAETLIRHPALSETVQRLMENDATRLRIHYPGGDEGNLWALEIRAWLVALGIDSGRVELAPGGPRNDAVLLQTVP